MAGVGGAVGLVAGSGDDTMLFAVERSVPLGAPRGRGGGGGLRPAASHPLKDVFFFSSFFSLPELRQTAPDTGFAW